MNTVAVLDISDSELTDSDADGDDDDLGYLGSVSSEEITFEYHFTKEEDGKPCIFVLNEEGELVTEEE